MGDITDLIKNINRVPKERIIANSNELAGCAIETSDIKLYSILVSKTRDSPYPVDSSYSVFKNKAIEDNNSELFAKLVDVSGSSPQPGELGYHLWQTHQADQMTDKQKPEPFQSIHKSEMAKIIGTSEHNVDKCMWKSRGIELRSDFCFKKSDIPIIKGYLKKYKLN